MKFQIGDKASFTKTVSESDIYLFAGITGDMNPAHIDDVAMKNSKFGGRIAHGMLCAGFISAVLGMRMPGPGTIYLGQTLKFLAPVRMGDTVTATAEVVEIIDNKRLKVHTTCTIQDGTVVVDGEALVLPPRD
ncbi:MAG TPA: MaoC family dehydratase [Symbiobacteriaceae bacterium]|jgi:3-hydroxybutyryl-CoA dehydratase